MIAGYREGLGELDARSVREAPGQVL